MHPPGHGRQTLDSLYPQARKLQFELKMQMSYLDSGRTGDKTDAELQTEARGNLNTLEQLLWQLDSLVQTCPKPMEKDTWIKKLQQLRSETYALGNTLEQHIYSISRRAVEARERESLMNRRNTGFDSGNGAMYAVQESESLQRSSQMVADLTSLSHSILGDLGEQRNRMKNVRTKLLDIANRLGLSSSLLRVIERRDTVDFWIVIGGMIVTLVFLYLCYAYTTQTQSHAETLSMGRSDRSGYHHAHRSRRSPSRSVSASRTHRSSRHHSSKRRSLSRSRSQERSRRTHHHRRNHRRHRSRSCSRSKHQHKRRKRDRHEKRSHRRSYSRSASVSKSKRQDERVKEKKETKKASSHESKTKETVMNGQKDLASKVSEDQKTIEGSECKMETSTVNNQVEETNNGVDVKYVEKQVEEKTKETNDASPMKPVVDVSSIQKDILKALADARNTIAGMKKKGTVTSVTSASVPLQTDEEETHNMDTSSPTKHVPELVQAPLTTVSPPNQNMVCRVQETTTEELDMFSIAALDDHDDDMTTSSSMAAITVDEVSLQSNCDDAEGYYSATIGEILNAKYRVLGTVGKGVFSTVVRCQCLSPVKTGCGGALKVVAIKMIRNNDVMRDAAQTELKILNELRERDPRDKKHCIRLVDSFSHRNHTALVFEPMQMNVREAMKKFGGKGGISIQAVRVFSKHLLIALHHLEQCGVIHADIKPDNILLDEKQTTIKLCDFGSAFHSDQGKQDPTPYLVSRFYRAPEIVLGLAYEKAVDMWSVGCCLYEMFTGKVLFPGSTNNEMLKLFMELKGKIPNKLIKKHRVAYIDQLEMEPHFTEDLKFCSRESDRVTGKPILRLMEILKLNNDLATSLLAAKSATDVRKLVLELRNLLDRMVTLDPSKRISVKDALAHPFVKG